MKKSHWMKIVTVSWFFAIGVIYQAAKDEKVQNTVWYPSQSKTQRLPASGALADFDKDRDLQIFEDLFTNQSFNKSLRYQTNFRFWTDKDDDYLREKAQLALHQGFSNTFTHNVQVKEGEEVPTIFGLLKNNLAQSFINNFIKTLYVFKIFDGTFQIDFEFSPEADSPEDFSNELGTNQLIQLSETGGLTSLLQEDTPLLHEKVLKEVVPKNDDVYQYQGGAMTIWLEILDLSWNPLNPIPNPKKNAVKGFIRYRRYFRLNDIEKLDLSFKTPELSIEKLTIKKAKDYNSPYITVDVYKSFDLSQPKPELDRVEIFFGKVLINRVKKGNSLLSGIADFFKVKSKNTGKFKLLGELNKTYSSRSFEVGLNKLVYNFKEEGFTSKSQLNIRFRHNTSTEDGRDKYKVRRYLLNKVGYFLIEQLNLKRFHKDI